jgi:ribonuclease-3
VAKELREGDLLHRALDAKSRLQQRSQALYGVTPHYFEVGAQGPDHDPVSTVRVVYGERMESTGTGRGKRAAEQAAAEAALNELERLHPPPPAAELDG